MSYARPGYEDADSHLESYEESEGIAHIEDFTDVDVFIPLNCLLRSFFENAYAFVRLRGLGRW